MQSKIISGQWKVGEWQICPQIMHCESKVTQRRQVFCEAFIYNETITHFLPLLRNRRIKQTFPVKCDDTIKPIEQRACALPVFCKYGKWKVGEWQTVRHFFPTYKLFRFFLHLI